MKMKELTQITGLSDRTVRYYIDHKVFRPEKENTNYAGRNNYDFTEKDIEQLEQIAVLRKYGFPIKEIKALLFEDKDTYQSVKEQIVLVEKESEIQTEQIGVLKSAEKAVPKSVAALCSLLKQNGELGKIPNTDVQSPYKPMYEKTKKANWLSLIFMFGMFGILLVVGLGNHDKISVAFDVDANKLPQGTAYIDLLIQMDPDDYMYVAQPVRELEDLNGEPIAFSEESEIYRYRDSQGYMSYSLHYYRAAQWNYRLTEMWNKTYYYNHYSAEMLPFQTRAKVAYVSESGEVLAVTNDVSIKDIGALLTVNEINAKGMKLKTFRMVDPRFLLGFQLVICMNWVLDYAIRKKEKP